MHTMHTHTHTYTHIRSFCFRHTQSHVPHPVPMHLSLSQPIFRKKLTQETGGSNPVPAQTQRHPETT